MKQKLSTIILSVAVIAVFGSLAIADLPIHPLQGRWEGQSSESDIEVRVDIEMSTVRFGDLDRLETSFSYISALDSTLKAEVVDRVFYFPLSHGVFIYFEAPEADYSFRLRGFKLGNLIIGVVSIRNSDASATGIITLAKVGPLPPD